MGAPKCVPSFEQRPGFPSGLRVLLVDGNAAARDRTEQQLLECSYEVTACASSAEAVVQISTAVAPFDVLLADKAAIGAIPAAPAAAGSPPSGPAPMRSGLLDSCKGVPCILMGSDPTPADVMLGVGLGAVDFLAKPLSQLKLRNIWQHTVRKMMSDMQIGNGKGLDRSGSSALPGAPLRQPAEAPAKAPAALPPRSPGGARSPLLHARCALHTCISSTNLASGKPERAEEGQAPAATAADDQPAPAAAPSAGQARCSPPPQSASGATATATHASMPLQSYGVPVPGTLGALPPGQCWGMPMPAVRAPGIVPPKAPAAAAQPQHSAAPWGYMGCGYMPHPAYMMMPPGNMYGPPPMAPPPGYGPCYTSAPMPGAYYPPAAPYPCAAPAATPRQPQQPHATGADAAKALDASLASLCDLDVDLDDVLQDLAAPDCDAPPPAPLRVTLKPPAAADDSCMGSGSTDCGEDAGCGVAALLRSGSGAVSSRGSMESCREALPRGLCGGDGPLCGGGGGGGGLAGDDDDEWGEMEADGLAALRRSGSLADLLAEPMAVVA